MPWVISAVPINKLINEFIYTYLFVSLSPGDLQHATPIPTSPNDYNADLQEAHLNCSGRLRGVRCSSSAVSFVSETQKGHMSWYRYLGSLACYIINSPAQVYLFLNIHHNVYWCYAIPFPSSFSPYLQISARESPGHYWRDPVLYSWGVHCEFKHFQRMCQANGQHLL